MDNTYFIFASDNGGCYSAGGKNGPFRGTKGTIFEGGTKVDAFVYSPLLKESQQGKVYEGLMHVTDWFPTILDMASVPYTPRSGFDLDGVSHVDAWDTNVPARTEMLYNSVHNVKNKGFDVMTNGWFAVRNEQYKLVSTTVTTMNTTIITTTGHNFYMSFLLLFDAPVPPVCPHPAGSLLQQCLLCPMVQSHHRKCR